MCFRHAGWRTTGSLKNRSVETSSEGHYSQEKTSDVAAVSCPGGTCRFNELTWVFPGRPVMCQSLRLRVLMYMHSHSITKTRSGGIVGTDGGPEEVSNCIRPCTG